LNQNTIIVGPWPDAAYSVELVGTVRPSPISEDNQTNFLSLYLPDLFLQAAMIYVAEYQRNFGATSNDPQMGFAYEQQYQTLLSSALVEENMKKFASVGWTPMAPTPVATPSR